MVISKISVALSFNAANPMKNMLTIAGLAVLAALATAGLAAGLTRASSR